MSVLSLISLFNGFTFTVFGIRLLNGKYEKSLSGVASLVDFCFAIWCLASAFFYVAPTEADALFWHRIASLGWIFFCPFAVHFFLILSGTKAKFKSRLWYMILYAVPVILLLETFLTNQTPYARGFVESQAGWGWTYVSNIFSVWFWLYIVYIGIAFTVALYLLNRWAADSGKPLYLNQAKSISMLCYAMMFIGLFTEQILPALSPRTPPFFNIIAILLGAALWFVVKRYRLMSVEEAASASLIVETVMEPILMLNTQGQIVKCNQATAELLKYKLENVLDRQLSDFYRSKQYQPQGLDRLMQNKTMTDVELDLIDSQGNILNIMACFSVVETPLDGFVGTVISLHDVTEHKKLTKALEKLANYDKLTDLPNRRMFFNRLESAIEDHNKHGSKFALVFLDLDGFKAVNDTYGHVVGDKLLIKVAAMLSVETRKQDIIARIGGDEFVLLFSDLEDRADLRTVIERLNNLFPGPIYVDDVKCQIGFSLGVSICPDDGTSMDTLIKLADDRMYSNKALKNN